MPAESFVPATQVKVTLAVSVVALLVLRPITATCRSSPAMITPPAELRFRKDGTLKGSLEKRLVVSDTGNGQLRTVVISLGGKAKVTD